MSVLLRHRRLHAWVAIAVLLLASLAPTLTHALGKGAGVQLIEVCTAQGMQWVEVGAADAQGSQPDVGHLLEHCPYCRTQGPVIGLPPIDAQLPLLTGLSEAPPTAFLAAPRRLHAWVSALPRAPPTAS